MMTSRHAGPSERDDGDAWWQVDLGEDQRLKCVVIEFEQEAKNYGYVIRTSGDGTNWEETVVQRSSREPRWGGPRAAVHQVDARGRYVRIEFTELPRRGQAGMREFGVFAATTESTYYAPIYDYRLRWNDVVYEPGELKAVAYKDGKEIGAAIVRTAGQPAALRLTPDRTQLAASGDDLCYVLVEAVDDTRHTLPARGQFGPLPRSKAQPKLRRWETEIRSPSNHSRPTQRKLFFGKAMLIVRTTAGPGGQLRINARSDGLADAQASCQVVPR